STSERAFLEAAVAVDWRFEVQYLAALRCTAFRALAEVDVIVDVVQFGGSTGFEAGEMQTVAFENAKDYEIGVDQRSRFADGGLDDILQAECLRDLRHDLVEAEELLVPALHHRVA